MYDNNATGNTLVPIPCRPINEEACLYMRFSGSIESARLITMALPCEIIITEESVIKNGVFHSTTKFSIKGDEKVMGATVLKAGDRVVYNPNKGKTPITICSDEYFFNSYNVGG
jgi:hypothetical protein